MLNFSCTTHAQQRRQQRGVTEDDLALVMAFGTETQSGFLLSKVSAGKCGADNASSKHSFDQ